MFWRLGSAELEAAGGGDGVLEAGVDAPVVPDHLGEPVHIGGLELGQLPVLQDAVDDGVLPPELVQHLGVGGIARLSLLHRGQAQLVEEDAAQLLGGVDVELLPRQRKDGCLGPCDPLGEHLSEADQRPPVHQHPFPAPSPPALGRGAARSAGTASTGPAPPAAFSAFGGGPR